MGGCPSPFACPTSPGPNGPTLVAATQRVIAGYLGVKLFFDRAMNFTDFEPAQVTVHHPTSGDSYCDGFEDIGSDYIELQMTAWNQTHPLQTCTYVKDVDPSVRLIDTEGLEVEEWSDYPMAI